METVVSVFVISALGFHADRVPVEAVKPPASISKRVEDLIVASGTVTFETITLPFDKKPPQPVRAAETRRYVLVCGVWETKDSSPRDQFVDFEIEQQVRDVSGHTWEAVSVKTVNDILERAAEFESSSLDPASLDPVFTAPLPKLKDGTWKSAGHPRLDGDPAGRLLLFRFPDFDVHKGHEYRYRVRLQTVDADKDGNRSQTIWSAWSKPSRWIKI